MGYDAYVRCNCFKEGKAKPFKYIQYVKEYTEYLELELPDEIKKNTELADKIEQDFYDWQESACEHEDMEIVSERIANISGMGALRFAIECCGGEKEFPTLATQLPECNGGFMPVELNESFRKDLEAFIEKSFTVFYFKNSCANSWSVSWSCACENIDTLLCEKDDTKMYVKDDIFRIEKNGQIIFQSSKFTIDRIINRRIIFSDKAQKVETSFIFNLKLFEKGNRQRMYFESEVLHNRIEFEGIYQTFLRLLDASDKSGNPICWS